MEKYRDMKIRKKANLKMIRNLVFFLLLIIFTFWFIFKDQDLGELVQVIKSVNLEYVFFGLIIMFLSHLTESINIRSVLVSLKEKRFSLLRALKYTSVGVFFSAITPAATGGQPVELYYMSKDNIKTSNGTMALLLELCGFQISTLSYSIICAILNPHLLDGGLVWFYILGLTINGFALIMMLLGVFSSKTSEKLLKIFIKLLKILKVKNLDIKTKKMENGLAQYAQSSKYIKEHKIDFVKAVLRVFVQIGLTHSIPYFIYRSFGLNELSFLEIFSMQAVLYTTVSGIPLPGAIGISETLFLKIYGIAFSMNILSGAMLLCRFVSFYFYLIIFAIVAIINAIKTKNVESEIDKDVNEIDESIDKETKTSIKVYA